jgi:2-dehydro-3-deoxygluconokinase
VSQHDSVAAASASTQHLMTVGEALAVFVVDDGLPLDEATRFRRTVAGAELNVAHGFVRLGHEAEMVTAVGDDALGTAVIDRLRTSGVRPHVSRVAAPTGVLIREPARGGAFESLHLRERSAATHLTPAMVEQAWNDQVSLVYLTAITLVRSTTARDAALELVALARAHGALVVLDPNLRQRLAPAERFALELSRLRGLVDIVVGDAPELALFAGTSPEDAASTLLDRGARVVVTKRGSAGSEATDGTKHATQPAVPTTVVDTVGAGDAFTAGFLTGYLETEDLQAGLELGAQVAARVVATPGDLEGFPRRRPFPLEGEHR